MEVKVVDKRDINEIVRIHIDAFKGFFLTELGKTFLKKYYSSVLYHPDGILLGCFENGKIISIEITSHHETANRYQLVLDEDYINKLITNQNDLESLDTVSSATVTSNALKKMITNVLE